MAKWDTTFHALWGQDFQKNLQDPLATQILEGKVKDGDTVAVTVEGGAITVNGERVEPDWAGVSGDVSGDGGGPNLRVLN